MPKQQPGKTYRGSRRLPKLPSRRYAAVVSTAVLGAALVAIAAGTVPDGFISEAGETTSQAMSVEDRLAAIDKANRSDDRYGPAVSANQGAPDVWMLPLKAKFDITTLFEMRWGTMHFGVDMAAPEGTPIYAAHAGIVTVSGLEGGYGLCVRIDHGNGIETVYGHQSALYVVVGEKVEAGDQIGRVGTTGFSTGAHLHFEVNINAGHYDPMKFMLQHGVDIENRQEAATGGTVIT